MAARSSSWPRTRFLRARLVGPLRDRRRRRRAADPPTRRRVAPAVHASTSRRARSDEVGPAGLSVWEVDWDGGSTVVALVSEDPSGNGWYHGQLAMLDLERGRRARIEPRRMLEGVALSPDGTRAAVVEGYSSDPGLLIGNVLVIDLASGRIDDPWPTCRRWAACPGPTTGTSGTPATTAPAPPSGSCGPTADARNAGPATRSSDRTSRSRRSGSSAAPSSASHQAHGLPPELATFDPATATWTRPNARQRRGYRRASVPGLPGGALDGVGRRDDRGAAADAPRRDGPWPLIVAVHGGPTWNWNAYFSDSEPNGVLLADAGYAVLQPNPRGSSGRGHAFAEAVIGIRAASTSVICWPASTGRSRPGSRNPARIGIAGLSYGGFMAAWAVTQSDRFAASVAASVVADFRSFHLTSEVASWDVGLLGGAWDDPAGPYHDRSPVVHARQPRPRRWSSPASSTGARRSGRASSCSGRWPSRAARRSCWCCPARDTCR